jgi:hypothetical protein
MGLLPRDDKLARRKGIGLRFAGLWVLSLLFGFLTGASPGYGQPSGNRIIYSRQPVFRIPFETDAGERRLQEVQLYVSEDRGQTWKPAATVPPEQRGFNFRAEHDGLYWFTVRTVDFAGRANPATLQGVRPQLEVYVDTQVPIVTLRPAPAREGAYAVEWDIREDNLDRSSFLLEYRLPSGSDWIPLTVEPAGNGQHSWTPSTSGTVDVRLRVRDLAKNEGEATIKLTPATQEYRPFNNLPGQDPGTSTSRTAPGKLWVNSTRVRLNYEIKDTGPSGVQAVELWYTRDGRTWEKYNEEREPKPPYIFEVHDEGVYGFTLIVRSGVGLSERPPRSGDPPQVWVEVDLTKPVVHWVNVDVGRGSDSGWLTITWKATDKNLGREPITLSYAKEPQGPWTPIASHVENTGRYRWQLPDGVPYSFLVRVEATDQAGNVGTLDTPKHVLVDLAQPKGLILGVEPANKEGAAGRDQGPVNRER